MAIGNGGREVGGNVLQGRCSREEDDCEISGMAADGRRGRRCVEDLMGGNWGNRGASAGEVQQEQREWWMEVEGMAARRSGGSGGGLRTAVTRGQRRGTVVGARSGGGRRGGGGGGTEACGGGDGWTPSPAFVEQPLEREITPLFLQMTAMVCGGGVPSHLIEPIMGREGKGPT